MVPSKCVRRHPPKDRTTSRAARRQRAAAGRLGFWLAVVGLRNARASRALLLPGELASCPNPRFASNLAKRCRVKSTSMYVRPFGQEKGASSEPGPGRKGGEVIARSRAGPLSLGPCHQPTGQQLGRVGDRRIRRTTGLDQWLAPFHSRAPDSGGLVGRGRSNSGSWWVVWVTILVESMDWGSESWARRKERGPPKGRRAGWLGWARPPVERERRRQRRRRACRRGVANVLNRGGQVARPLIPLPIGSPGSVDGLNSIPSSPLHRQAAADLSGGGVCWGRHPGSSAGQWVSTPFPGETDTHLIFTHPRPDPPHMTILGSVGRHFSVA